MTEAQPRCGQMPLRRIALACGLGTLAAWAALYRLGSVWGSTSSERRATLEGDEIVPRPSFVTDHAIDIAASPAEVWPWLLQIGWHRGGWYTQRWVDRLLFPANWPSADGILPEFQRLAVGDRIPDGAPETGCFFEVQRIDDERLLVLSSTTHLPPQLMQRPGIGLHWTWTFAVTPVAPHRTRFHFRSRIAIRPFWLRLAYRATLIPADFVMARSMCRGLKQRAERLHECGPTRGLN